MHSKSQVAAAPRQPLKEQENQCGLSVQCLLVGTVIYSKGIQLRLGLDPATGQLQFSRGMTFEHEPIEWDDGITLLIDRLEEKSAAGGLTRPERALMDVIETVQLLDPEGDGLHEFWQSPLDHTRIINSFDLVGSGAMVDVLNASQWCQTRNADRDQYTETESDYFATIEEDLYEALGELPDLVGEFVEDELTE